MIFLKVIDRWRGDRNFEDGFFMYFLFRVFFVGVVIIRSIRRILKVLEFRMLKNIVNRYVLIFRYSDYLLIREY